MNSTQRSVKSILIVEDDDVLRDTLSLMLQEEGYRVAGAANGQEAIDRLRGGEPVDLILLDLMMPVKDGWQFRAEQREDPALACIPVVIISADCNAEQNANDLGAADCLQKPVEFDSLLDKLGRYA